MDYRLNGYCNAFGNSSLARLIGDRDRGYVGSKRGVERGIKAAICNVDHIPSAIGERDAGIECRGVDLFAFEMFCLCRCHGKTDGYGSGEERGNDRDGKAISN